MMPIMKVDEFLEEVKSSQKIRRSCNIYLAVVRDIDMLIKIVERQREALDYLSRKTSGTLQEIADQALEMEIEL